MAWGDKTTATQLTTIDDTTEQFFDQTPTLNPGELLHVEIEGNFVGSPTDDLVVNVYTTLDDTSENWDDTAFMSIQVDNSPDPNKLSFTISGIYKFRIGVLSSGNTDTITSADMAFRRDNVDLV